MARRESKRRVKEGVWEWAEGLMRVMGVIVDERIWKS